VSAWLVLAAYVAAVNPFRLRQALPGSGDRADTRIVATGALIAFAVSALLVAASVNLLDGLQITPETWRIAAGVVAALAGVRVFVAPGRADEPELDGRRAAVVPVAFPLLITPEVVALVAIFGATESAAVSIGGLAVALAAGVATGALRRLRPSVWTAGARMLAAVLILAGIALIVEGIRDV
jgi:small neutral amino acid transporter SnatA (MarC family)